MPRNPRPNPAGRSTCLRRTVSQAIPSENGPIGVRPLPRDGRLRSWGWRRSMNTIGVLLLAAATAGDGFGYSKPGVGLKKLLRPHVVSHGPPPPGGVMPAGMGGDM